MLVILRLFASDLKMLLASKFTRRLENYFLIKNNNNNNKLVAKIAKNSFVLEK